ncbi:MAG: peptidase [Gemmatimonadota bacterium]
MASSRACAPPVALLGLAAALLVAPIALSAQLAGGTGANFGFATLSPGFMPDPHVATIVSGGSVDVGSLGLGEGCVGYATSRPDYTVDLTSPSEHLRFYVEGEGDTGLVVAGPGNRIQCDDDTRGLDPMVTFETAAAGRYDVWVSSYSRDENLSSTLYVTELTGEVSDVDSERLLPGGSASNFGRTALSAGFRPDPYDVRVTSGGAVSVARMGLGASCVGFATQTPDYIVDYSAGADMLRFFVEGEGDTALIVNAPDGSWHCDDDSFGTVDPTVSFDTPDSGQYDIWIASYASGANIPGRLVITELSSQRPQY